MRKVLISVLFILLSTSLFAPASNTLVFIYESSKNENSLQDLIYAIGKVESELDTFAYNPREKAVGYFQIRPIRLKDYNNRTGNNYRIQDMYNYKKAEEVFIYYANLIGVDNYETIAKEWNGSGPMTIVYWNKVRQYLNEDYLPET